MSFKIVAFCVRVQIPKNYSTTAGVTEWKTQKKRCTIKNGNKLALAEREHHRSSVLVRKTKQNILWHVISNRLSVNTADKFITTLRRCRASWIRAKPCCSWGQWTFMASGNKKTLFRNPEKEPLRSNLKLECLCPRPREEQRRVCAKVWHRRTQDRHVYPQRSPTGVEIYYGSATSEGSAYMGVMWVKGDERKAAPRGRSNVSKLRAWWWSRVVITTA